MSKLYLKGNAAGTGRLILESPDTDDELVLTFPAQSGLVSMANSEGMPVMADGTPVVESGSNSDGDWTKWGDGTQVCSGESPTLETAVANAADTTLNHSGDATLDFPMVFDEAPRVVHNATSPAQYYSWSVSDSSPNRTQMRSLKIVSPMDGAFGRVVYVAHGRWK